MAKLKFKMRKPVSPSPAKLMDYPANPEPPPRKLCMPIIYMMGIRIKPSLDVWPDILGLGYRIHQKEDFVFYGHAQAASRSTIFSSK